MGAAAAAIAAEKGAQVVIVARDQEALENAAQRIRQHGSNVRVMAGDISHHATCQKIVEQTIEAYGRIDAVINNAAIIGPICAVADLPPDDWARTLEVNLLGPVLLCRESIPYLRQTHGRIINVSSGVAFGAIPAGSAYSVSKSALNHFSKILSVEEPTITVLFINPGSMDTQMMADVREKGQGVGPFEEFHRYFVDLYEKNKLPSVKASALSTITLALSAPLEMSGKYIDFTDEQGQNMIRECTAILERE